MEAGTIYQESGAAEENVEERGDLLWLTAEMREEPEDEGESGAEEEASDDRKVKGGVFAAMDDVAGEFAETERKFAAEIEKRAEQD